MHHLADLTALNDQSCLYTLTHIDEIMMDSTHCEQGGNSHMVAVGATVGEDNIVESVIDALLGFMTELVDSIVQADAALRGIEEDGQLHGVKALVADVTKDVELRIGQDGMRQSYHLTVGLVGIEDTRTHTTDIFGERHDEILADGVDGRVGHLCELLTEIVEEDLRTIAQYDGNS